MLGYIALNTVYIIAIKLILVLFSGFKQEVI